MQRPGGVQCGAEKGLMPEEMRGEGAEMVKRVEDDESQDLI